MIRTKVTQTSALAGFAPAGKPDSVNRQERCCHAAQNHGAISWLMVLSVAGGLAALGVARAQAPAPTETVLHNFPEPQPKGANPVAGLLADSEGNFYGTAPNGGTATFGVVFKVDASGRQSRCWQCRCRRRGLIWNSSGNESGQLSSRHRVAEIRRASCRGGGEISGLA